MWPFLDRQRMKAARRQAARAAARTAPDSALARLLAAPLVPPDTPVGRVPFLALDLETTGLDPARHAMLSAGCLTVTGGLADMTSCYHALIRADGPLDGGNVAIHRITDDAARDGAPLKTVLDALLARLTGCVLLAHHAPIECGFLDAACRRLYGIGLPLQAVDTMVLERRRLARRHDDTPPGGLRLDAVRRRYGLPRYGAHHALTDALACGEVFLAQCAHMGDGLRLSDIL